MTTWQQNFEAAPSADLERRREALCTLGNGYWATRGAVPESTASTWHYPGTYAAGVYNRLKSTLAGQTTEDESLVNVPNWLPFTFSADGGGWLGTGEVSILDETHVLDIRRGVLSRTFETRDEHGLITAVKQRRFMHMREHHLAGLEVTLTPRNWSGVLRVRSELDSSVENTGVDRYRQLSSRHLDLFATGHVDSDIATLSVRTNQSEVAISQAMRTRLVGEGTLTGLLESRPIIDEARIGHELSISVHQSRPVVIEKIVAIATSRDWGISSPELAALAAAQGADSFCGLLSTHEQTWHELWHRFHLEVAHSTLSDIGNLRLYLFHMLQCTYASRGGALDVGVAARGLHGEAYRGHVFWDELFIFPILLLRLPEVAESLLLYRYRRLPTARRAAIDAGFRGALFPWQSGSDGREETPLIHLNPNSGHWLADVTHLQRHVGLAIAFNVWRHYQACGDESFLEQYGAELIFEIARFFASLTTLDEHRDKFVIRGVIGPDEFHSQYPGSAAPGIDNNAYTNVMTMWLMRVASECLDVLAEPRRSELIEELQLERSELDRWEDISHNMFVPFHSDGDDRFLISQFEGYELLEELDWDAYRQHYSGIERLDRILEAEGDTINRYKAGKQADVLMLFYLLTAEELAEILQAARYPWTSAHVQPTVQYYLARSSNGSTLSAVVNAWVLARSNRCDAVERYAETLQADLALIQAGTTGEGIHLAAMCGAVDILQRCFAGIELATDALRLNPEWPHDLGALELAITYRGCALTLNIRGNSVSIANTGGPKSLAEMRPGLVNVEFDGVQRQLGVGESLTLR